MNDVTIKVNIPAELTAHLSRAQRMSNIRGGVQDAGRYLITQASTYPAESHRPQPFVSDKQRRGFFAKLRAGEITVPYQRTQELAKGWQMVSHSGGLGVTVGNNTAWAELVQGAKQTRYHQITGWRDVTKIAQDEASAVFNIIATAAARDFE